MSTPQRETLIAEAPDDSKAFAELKSQVKQAGLLDMQPGYYFLMISATLAFAACGWVALFWIGDSWWQVGVAVYMALCSAQLGFLMHDASHRQISHSRKWTQFVGYAVGDLVLGVSFGWWVLHHGRHHSNPNHLELDPDITRRVAIFSRAHADRRQGWKRFVVKHQAGLYFPLTTLDTLRMRVASIGALRRNEVRHRKLEADLMIVHGILFFGTLFWVLGVGKAITFILVYHMFLGAYLGMSFAPNHKGMPTREGDAGSWLERQVVTSRNLRPGPLTDFLYGGLNYQIEHHLFPTMPRNNFKRARPIVRDFCLAHGLPYVETGTRESLRAILDHLEWASEPVRQEAADT